MGGREAVEGTVARVVERNHPDYGTSWRALVHTPSGGVWVTVAKAWQDAYAAWAVERRSDEPLVDLAAWLEGRRVRFEASLEREPCARCGGTGHEPDSTRARRPTKAVLPDTVSGTGGTMGLVERKEGT